MILLAPVNSVDRRFFICDSWQIISRRLEDMKSGFDANNVDKTVRPQDDFFHFAVGGWLKRNPIPSSESRWGSFDILRERSWKALHGILEDLSRKRAKAGTEKAKLRDFYRTAMDERARERQGITPLKKYFSRINGIASRRDFFRVLGELHEMGIIPFWTPIVDQDEKRSENMILHFWQAHLILPDREYYLRQDARSKEIRKRYLKYMERMLGWSGQAGSHPRKAAEIILKLETALAKASRSRAALREVEKQYSKMSPAALRKLAPRILWAEYNSGLGLRRERAVIVGQPEFFKAMDIMIAKLPLGELKLYLNWFLINSSSYFLSDKFIREKFRFHGTVISGVTEIKPLWKRAAMSIDSAMGFALGKIYIREYFGKRAKKEIDELVDNVIRAYAARILKLDWMSAGTKRRALKKLAAIKRKIAYPRRWRDYRKLDIKTDSYLENYFRSERFESRRLISKLSKPVDREEWFMTPTTVNAYYSASLNEIVFPAGILQPPFFDPDAFDAVNYAGIGSTIGHELTHGFDDQGSKFDENGNMREWWSRSDRKKFMKKALGLVRQFDRYMVAYGIHLNGKLTLGENIADLGGLAIAYDAFKNAMRKKRLPKKIAGWTPDQLFFLGFAQVERGHARPEEERRLTTIDPHAPARYRANGVLVNMEEFHRAFGSKSGDAMFRRPRERVKIW